MHRSSPRIERDASGVIAALVNLAALAAMVAYIPGNAQPIYGSVAHAAAMQQMLRIFPDMHGCRQLVS